MFQKVALGVLAFLAALSVVLIVNLLVFISGLPAWELSATNTPDGLAIELFKADEDAPSHQAVLEDAEIPEDIFRKTREEVAEDVVKTVFFDETIRPGRWTFVIAGEEIDTWPGHFSVRKAEP